MAEAFMDEDAEDCLRHAESIVEAVKSVIEGGIDA